MTFGPFIHELDRRPLDARELGLLRAYAKRVDWADSTERRDRKRLQARFERYGSIEDVDARERNRLLSM